MEKFLFLDLDDTVFQTRRKCTHFEQASPASYNLSGEPSSFFSPKQKELLTLLNEQWRIIPTTARTQDAYARVDLGITCNDGVILNHGATILSSNGEEDTHWRTYMEPQLKKLQPVFSKLKQSIEQHAELKNLQVLVRIINESKLDYYVEVRHHQANHSELQLILEKYINSLIQEHGSFQAYLNSNSLTILPHIVNKSHAVAFYLDKLRQQYGEIVTMGMGDSLSDVPFIAQCDYAMIPQGTQLYQQLIES